jgi:hypothetical protein
MGIGIVGDGFRVENRGQRGCWKNLAAIDGGAWMNSGSGKEEEEDEGISCITKFCPLF